MQDKDINDRNDSTESLNRSEGHDEVLLMKKKTNVSFFPVEHSRKVVVIESEDDKCPRRYCRLDMGLLRLVLPK
jgi:hypothetical protein